MRWMRLLFFSAAAQVALCTTACAQPGTTAAPASPQVTSPRRSIDLTASVDRLWSLFHRRAELAVEVAKWKWNAKAAILDRAREQKLLDDMAAAARAKAIDPAFVVDVFRAQLEVSRSIQVSLFAKWKAEGIVKHPNVADLRKTLRPALDEIGKQILDVLAQLNPVRGTSQLRAAVETRIAKANHDSVWTLVIERIAFAPLFKFRTR
jgi:chorismate mutase-like protein